MAERGNGHLFVVLVVTVHSDHAANGWSSENSACNATKMETDKVEKVIGWCNNAALCAEGWLSLHNSISETHTDDICALLPLHTESELC